MVAKGPESTRERSSIRIPVSGAGKAITSVEESRSQNPEFRIWDIGTCFSTEIQNLFWILNSGFWIPLTRSDAGESVAGEEFAAAGLSHDLSLARYHPPALDHKPGRAVNSHPLIRTIVDAGETDGF